MTKVLDSYLNHWFRKHKYIYHVQGKQMVEWGLKAA